jgi:hypothetical protein
MESILEDLCETLLDTKHGLAGSGKGRSQDSTASKRQAPVGSSSREQVSPETSQWSLQKGTFTEEIKATLEKHIGWRTLPYLGDLVWEQTTTKGASEKLRIGGRLHIQVFAISDPKALPAQQLHIVEDIRPHRTIIRAYMSFVVLLEPYSHLGIDDKCYM